MILGVDLLEFLRIDDPIGAWPVHGLCGIWGTLSLGLFACGPVFNAAGSSPTGIPGTAADGSAVQWLERTALPAGSTETGDWPNVLVSPVHR